MSGSPRPSDWHDRRVPARLTLAASDPAPAGEVGPIGVKFDDIPARRARATSIPLRHDEPMLSASR